MDRIAKLPPDIAQKIAAGEVIERPVSVVKELVENAVDAGASEIVVALEAGGTLRIAVRDDGQGMSRRDAELCFERHATSKIASADDLLTVSSLGFRGEALASIAAVSRLTLKTSEGGTEAGTQVDREGGAAAGVKDIAFPRGTSVEVRDLFFNLPARRKFMRGESSELTQIVKYLTNVALAYPDLRLKARHGSRAVLDCPPVAGLRERIFQLHGQDRVAALMELEWTADGSRVFGFASRPPAGRPDHGRQFLFFGVASRPPAGRPDRGRQFFFVNHRPVRDKVLSSALQQAFRGLLEKDRWPEAFLFLEIAPAEVDVNVHPAKSEVRFRNSSSVFQLVLRAVERARAREVGVKPVAVTRPASDAAGLTDVEYLPGAGSGESEFPFRVEDAAARFDGSRLLPDAAAAPAPDAGAPDRRVLGQYADAYIVAVDADGIVIIDQHNAHERVLFDRYDAIDKVHTWPVTMSLIPLLVELSPSQTLSLEANAEILAESGFRAEPMGGRSFALREYPDIFKPEEAMSAFLGLLDEMRQIRAEEKKAKMLATLACRTAIKAGQPLPREKMEFLVRELFRTSNPAVCPHGRPIVVRLSKLEIEKGLRRR